MRSVRGSETAEANGPGYEAAAHEKQGGIVTETRASVFQNNLGPRIISSQIRFMPYYATNVLENRHSEKSSVNESDTA